MLKELLPHITTPELTAFTGIEAFFIAGAVYGFYRATMRTNLKETFRQNCFVQEVGRHVRRQANKKSRDDRNYERALRELGWTGSRETVKR